MTDWLKKNWIEVLIAAIAIGAIIILFGECNKPKDVSYDKKYVDSLLQVANKKYVQYKVDSARWSKETQSLKKYADSVADKQDSLDKHWAHVQKEAQDYITMYGQALAGHNDSSLHENCKLAIIYLDTMISVAKAYRSIIQDKDNIIDRMNYVSDSTIKSLRALYNESSDYLSQTSLKYGKLDYDYSELGKKFKRKQVLTKVEAGVILVLLGWAVGSHISIKF